MPGVLAAHSVQAPCGHGDNQCQTFTVECREPLDHLLLRFSGIHDSHYIGVNRVRLFGVEGELAYRVVAVDGHTEGAEQVACVGVDGGWWAACGEEHSLLLELQDEGPVTSIGLWCANAGASPRELRLCDARAELPELCAVLQEAQPNVRDVACTPVSPILHKVQPCCGSGDDGCQAFAVACREPLRRLLLRFKGIHDSYYIGVNRLRLFAAEGELAYRVILADGSTKGAEDAACLAACGGWWAVCGEEHSLILELESPACITSIGLWCANAGATPRELRVAVDLKWLDELVQVLEEVGAEPGLRPGRRAQRLLRENGPLLAALAPRDARLRGALLAPVLQGRAPRFPLSKEDALGRLQAQLFCDLCQTSQIQPTGRLTGLEWQELSWPQGEMPVLQELEVSVASRLPELPESCGAEWLGTGLFVPPGGTISIAAEACGRGWSAKVGAHTDDISCREEWRRWPSVSLDVALVPGSAVTLFTPFGGLLYLVRAQGAAAACRVRCWGNALRQPTVSVAAGVDAEALEARPGGWVDCEGEQVILTLPVSSVRAAIAGGADLLAALAFYDRLWACYHELSPRTDPRRQRIVPDVQTSHGWMHAGYPVMTHFGEVLEMDEKHPIPRILDVERVQKEGNWGLFHELGHNMQRDAWTFEGTVEVTVNLFTLWGFARLCQDRLAEHLGAPEDFFRDGCPRQRWNSDPFLALRTYAQVIAAFGWEPLQATFRDYAAEGQVARDYAAQVRDFVCRWSLAAGRDLRPHWRKWGFQQELAGVVDSQLAALDPWCYN